MTNLRQLLTFNMKKARQKLGLSQARLAEKAGLSTQYVAMIEICRKFPSPEILEQIASALGLDTPELFSMPPSAERSAIQLQEKILTDIEKTVGDTINIAVRSAVSKLVTRRLKELRETGRDNGELIYEDITGSYHGMAAEGPK